MLALSVPAAAGITQIVGGGTGGNVGLNQVGTGGTTITVTTDTTIPVGSLVVLGISLRAISGISSCTDNASTSNTYTLNWVGATTTTTTGYAYSVTGFSLPAGSIITCTFTSTAQKGMIATAWNNPDPTPFDSASPTFNRNTGTAISIGPSGTLACPATTGNCELLFGVWTTSTSISPITEDAAFTDMGTITSQAFLHVAVRLVTTNTPVSYAATAGSSSAWSMWMPSFKAATSVAAVNRLMFRAVP